MVIIRPSVVGVSAEEPMPGWTDTLGLLQGFSLMLGLGILKDTQGRADGTGDMIPVDYVAKHILVSIPYAIK